MRIGFDFGLAFVFMCRKEWVGPGMEYLGPVVKLYPLGEGEGSGPVQD